MKPTPKPGKAVASKPAVHSPLPFRTISGNQVYSADGKAVADCHTARHLKPISKSRAVHDHADDEANAAFICRAVNSHAALVQACQNARNVLAALAVGTLKEIKADSPALSQLRSALKLAQEEA